MMGILIRDRAKIIGLLGILVGFVLTSSVVAADRPLVGEQVASRLAAAGDSLAVWIFLENKDPLDSGLGRIAPNTSWIGERAVNRHQIKGLPLVTEDDRPLSPDAVSLLEDTGVRVRTVSRWFTAVSGLIDRATLEKLAAISWVDSIRVVQTYRRPLKPEPSEIPVLPRSLMQTDEDSLYGNSYFQLLQIGIIEAHREGYSGSGILVGFLDTGFNLDHAAFAVANVIDTYDFINDDVDVADDDPLQMDHGTKVWSVCGAYVEGELIGAVHSADFLLAKTEIKNSQDIAIEEDYFVAGLEWCYSLGADIVSSSLGYPDFYDYGDLNGRTARTTIGVNMAASRGVLVVTAAGNEGNDIGRPWIIPPADSDSAVAVGAVYFSGNKVGFSSIGPTADGRIKPDVMAMGSGVWVADDAQHIYTSASGTSYSTPLVAGACALMLQKDPSLMPMEIIQRLRETAGMAEAPNNEMGYGIVNLPLAMGLDSDTVSIENNVLACPNPFTQVVEFKLPGEVPFATAKQMRVFTAAGEQVYSAEFFGRSVFWKATNDAGEELAGGIYLCWFKVAAREYTVKVAYMRRE